MIYCYHFKFEDNVMKLKNLSIITVLLGTIVLAGCPATVNNPATTSPTPTATPSSAGASTAPPNFLG